jgi:hypothetical protein
VIVRLVALAIRSAFEASDAEFDDCLRGHSSDMVVKQFLDLRLKLFHIDNFLIPKLDGAPKFTELLPVSFEAFDLLLAKNVVELFRRQRDMQAFAEGAEARIEFLPLRFVCEELLELLHILLVADGLEQVP